MRAARVRHNGRVRPSLANRAMIADAPRVVVKIGSSSLTAPDGTLNERQVEDLVRVLARRVGRGHHVVLVSSGAIAAGIRPLGLRGRPKGLPLAHAAASVGQGLLMARYAQEFGRYSVTVGQVLLTVEDLVRRQHYVNARRAVQRLLKYGVVPVVNENDTVATEQIRFGDNDRLAALVAHLVRADALVLLTDVDGLYDGPPSQPGTRLIPYVGSTDDLGGIRVTGRGSSVGTGGMITKLHAAQAATASGIPVVLTSADRLEPALAGEEVGTWFAATGARRTSRRLWLAHAAEARGVLTLDAGAVTAVLRDGRSLLAAGVTGCDGDFEAGDVIEMRAPDSTPVARGVSGYDAAEVRAMAGKRSTDLVGPDGRTPRPVVHRDDLALVRSGRA